MVSYDVKKTAQEKLTNLLNTESIVQATKIKVPSNQAPTGARPLYDFTAEVDDELDVLRSRTSSR